MLVVAKAVISNNPYCNVCMLDRLLYSFVNSFKECQESVKAGKAIRDGLPH